MSTVQCTKCPQAARIATIGLRSRPIASGACASRSAVVGHAQAQHFSYAKAAPPPAQPAVTNFAESNPLVYKSLFAAAVAVAAYVACAVLNGIRGWMRKTWLATVAANGPSSLAGTVLSALLNVVGVDLASVSPGAPKTPAPAPAALSSNSTSADPAAMATHLADRTGKVQDLFPGSLSADDFLARVEVALAAHGFRGDNSLALTNVCRDESTGLLTTKINEIWGNAFNINGLGAVLTCGKTGIGAGISHAPINEDGRENYVFFAFPHVGVDESGKPAAIHRPGRAGESAACGALLFALNAVKENGVSDPEFGTHDPKEPEASILMQSLAKQLKKEGTDVASLDIVSMTKVAERAIASDLDFLISQAVDAKKANYAVITGVQIHSWASPDSGPTIEYVMPSSAYIVIDGQKSTLDLAGVPALTPRQMAVLAAGGPSADGAVSYLTGSCVKEVLQPDPAATAASPLLLGPRKSAGGQEAHSTPAWANQFTTCC